MEGTVRKLLGLSTGRQHTFIGGLITNSRASSAYKGNE
jgi:hypothetical protein